MISSAVRDAGRGAIQTGQLFLRGRSPISVMKKQIGRLAHQPADFSHRFPGGGMILIAGQQLKDRADEYLRAVQKI